MITVIFKECNGFSQKEYDRMVDGLQLHRVECTCGKGGCLIRHGRYERSVKLGQDPDPLRLSVQRVRCKECGATHALIPSTLVPYSQITLRDQQRILDLAERGLALEPVMEENPLIDESNIGHVIRQFRRHWRQRLLSLALGILDSLTVPCLSNYSRQFMQIRCTPNKLCTCTHIA